MPRNATSQNLGRRVPTLLIVLGLLLAACAVPRPKAAPPSSTSDVQTSAVIEQQADAIPVGNGRQGAVLWGSANTVRVSLSALDHHAPAVAVGRLELVFPASERVESFGLDLERATATASVGESTVEVFAAATASVVMVRCRGTEPLVTLVRPATDPRTTDPRDTDPRDNDPRATDERECDMPRNDSE